MSESFEDSLPPSGPSIAESASPLLGSVCRVAAAAPPHGRLAAALDRIVRWTGADRAFVAERGPGGNPTAPRIVARSVQTEPGVADWTGVRGRHSGRTPRWHHRVALGGVPS